MLWEWNRVKNNLWIFGFLLSMDPCDPAQVRGSYLESYGGTPFCIAVCLLKEFSDISSLGLL